MFTRPSTSCNNWVFSIPVAVSICFSIAAAFFRNKVPIITGTIIPAVLLQIPAMLIRLAALSIGPMIVKYGLDAVCNSAKAEPCTNMPVRNKPKEFVLAAGTKSKEPNPNTNNPVTSPFLNPIFFNIQEDGNAKKK